MRTVVTKKLVLVGFFGFCGLELLDWTGVTGRRFPSSWSEALIQICVNVLWTAFFTAISYLFMIRRRAQSSICDGHDLAEGSVESKGHRDPNK